MKKITLLIVAITAVVMAGTQAGNAYAHDNPLSAILVAVVFTLLVKSRYKKEENLGGIKEVSYNRIDDHVKVYFNAGDVVKLNAENLNEAVLIIEDMMNDGYQFTSSNDGKGHSWLWKVTEHINT